MKRAVLILAVIAIASIVAAKVTDPNSYAIRVLCLVLLTAAMGQAWNIVGGYNQISLGHGAFFGIGAYTSTVLQVTAGISPWIGAVAGMIAAIVFALFLSLPTMRLKGPYFALATLAAAEACNIAASVLRVSSVSSGGRFRSACSAEGKILRPPGRPSA